MQNIDDLMQWKINKMYHGLYHISKNAHVFEAILAHYYPPKGFVYVDTCISERQAKNFKETLNIRVDAGILPNKDNTCPYCIAYFTPDYEHVYKCEYGQTFDYCLEKQSHWYKCDMMFEEILLL